MIYHETDGGACGPYTDPAMISNLTEQMPPECYQYCAELGVNPSTADPYLSLPYDATPDSQLEHFGNCKPEHCEFLQDCGDPDTMRYYEHEAFTRRELRKRSRRRALIEKRRLMETEEKEAKRKRKLSAASAAGGDAGANANLACGVWNGQTYCPAGVEPDLEDIVDAKTEQRRKLSEWWEERGVSYIYRGSKAKNHGAMRKRRLSGRPGIKAMVVNSHKKIGRKRKQIRKLRTKKKLNKRGKRRPFV